MVVKTLRGGLARSFESNSTLIEGSVWVEAWRRDLASEKGYVIDEARALLTAANRKVACADGLAR